MLKIKTSMAMAGMTLAKAVYDVDGKLLIDKGIKLKKSYIDKLLQYRIQEIYIHWNRQDSWELSQVIAESTKIEALNHIKETVNNIKISQEINLEKLEKSIIQIIEELVSDKGILLNLTDIRTIDDYTFGHSVNVCVLSLIMAISLGYHSQSLKNLGLGALLHDIGKVYVDNKLLNKPGILTEDEYNQIQKHPMLGYEIITKIEGLDPQIGWIIRDHHERYDGKGYPNGLWGKNINVFARIVAICDVYDALTSNRVYRRGIPAHEAIEYLISMGNHQFDYDLVKIFLRHLCIYPKGTLVKLQSGEEGIVVDINQHYPTRPIVEIVKDMKGNPLKTTKKIDLTKTLNNAIAYIVQAV